MEQNNFPKRKIFYQGEYFSDKQKIVKTIIKYEILRNNNIFQNLT